LVPIFTFASRSRCHSASAYQIPTKSDHPRQSYDVISIFQHGGHGIAILLPVSDFMISLISEGRSLPAYQISATCLNSRLRFYYFRFLKQTSAMLEFYFQFRFLHLHHHWHVILRLPTKFHPYRTIRDGVMTSYPFFKMAARASQFYFRFWFWWFRLTGKVEIYLHTKFLRDISTYGWDITTSSFWKQTSTMLEFYHRFRFLLLRQDRHVILHLPTKFCPYRTIHYGVMTSYLFSPSAILNYLKITADHPRSANAGLRWILKFRLDWIYSFGDIAISVLRGFLAWNCSYTWLYPPCMHRMRG